VGLDFEAGAGWGCLAAVWAGLAGLGGTTVLTGAFAFESGNGLGAANFVRSLETFDWLVVFWWWRERVCFVPAFCFVEISSAAICRVTEPTDAIASRANPNRVEHRHGKFNQHVIARHAFYK